MISLRGKRALVTGGSRGIGAATALLLAECGADVGIGYRSRQDEAADVVQRLAGLGVRAFAHGACSTAPSGSSEASTSSLETRGSGRPTMSRSRT